ncbi:MAG: hypothetical protein P8Y23_05860 [Candidatus Lokiarchaeota archaeon]
MKFDPEREIQCCAFNHSCTLPKSKEVCNFPNFKACPEYQARMIKLKMSSTIPL